MDKIQEWFPYYTIDTDPIEYIKRISELPWINQLKGKLPPEYTFDATAIGTGKETLPDSIKISYMGPSPTYIKDMFADIEESIITTIDNSISETWDYTQTIETLSTLVQTIDKAKSKTHISSWNTRIEIGDDNFPIVMKLDKILEANPTIENDLLFRNEAFDRFWERLERNIASKLHVQKTLSTQYQKGTLGTGITKNDLFKIIAFLENNNIIHMPKGHQGIIVDRICNSFGESDKGYRQVKSKYIDWDISEFSDYLEKIIAKAKPNEDSN
jgi:hypothetical protein